MLNSLSFYWDGQKTRMKSAQLYWKYKYDKIENLHIHLTVFQDGSIYLYGRTP